MDSDINATIINQMDALSDEVIKTIKQCQDEYKSKNKNDLRDKL